MWDSNRRGTWFLTAGTTLKAATAGLCYFSLCHSWLVYVLYIYSTVGFHSQSWLNWSSYTNKKADRRIFICVDKYIYNPNNNNNKSHWSVFKVVMQPTVAQRARQRQRNKGVREKQRERERGRDRDRERERQRESGKTVPQQPLVSEEQRCYFTKAFYMTLQSSGKGGWGGERGQGGKGVGRDGQDQTLPMEVVLEVTTNPLWQICSSLTCVLTRDYKLNRLLAKVLRKKIKQWRG